MAETKERYSKVTGGLLGPKRTDKYMEWRATRDKRIAKAIERAKAKPEDSHERK